MSVRSEYRRLMGRLHRLHGRWGYYTRRGEARFKDYCAANWRGLHPRSRARKDLSKRLMTEHPEVFDKVKFLRLWSWESRKARIESYKADLERRLDALAPSVLRAGSRWRKVRSVDTWEFSTQTDPVRYVMAKAEQIAAEYRSHGIPARIVARLETRRRAYGFDYQSGKIEVQVKGDAVTRDALQRLPVMSLRTWLKDCWKRGVNPRVYNPFLPVGLEEQLKVGYFGEDLRKEPVS